MAEFEDVARARASYKIFVDALNAGREIVQRAGVVEAPPIPDFDTVYRRMSPETRAELFTALREQAPETAADTIRFWQPLIRRAFGVNSARS